MADNGNWLIYGPLIILVILILILFFFYVRERVRSSYDLEHRRRALDWHTTEVNKLATALGMSIIIQRNSSQDALTHNKPPASEVPNQNGGGDARNGIEILPAPIPTPSAPPISTPTPAPAPIIRHQAFEIPENIDEVDEDANKTRTKKEIVTVDIAVGDDEELLPMTPPPLPSTPQPPPVPKPRKQIKQLQVVNGQVHHNDSVGAGDANPNEPGCSKDVENVLPNENTNANAPVPKPRKNLPVQ